MDPNTWSIVSQSVRNIIGDFAAKRRASRALLAKRTELMASWYAWQKTQMLAIETQYKAAEKKILGNLPTQIEAATKAEVAAKALADNTLCKAETLYRQLLSGGHELPPIEMPDGVSVSYDVVPIELDRSKIPTNMLILDTETAKKILRTSEISGVGKSFEPKFTVRT